jgi:aryl-alcohol dehydrogenase-like predicted oxidoreductase
MGKYSAKLALGTVQFGLDYGISNDDGKVSADAVSKILHRAKDLGVAVLDTAYAYGDSENVLGQCLQGFANSESDAFRIVSKYPPGERPAVAEVLRESLERLGREKLYGYLFHSLDTYRAKPERWVEMCDLRERGLVEKVGFSLYQPQDALDLLADGLDAGKQKIDLVQVPFGVLDQRWAAVWPELKAAGIEVHVRSVFLQGLVFRETKGLDAHFAGAIASLDKLREMAEESGMSVAALCLGFALAQAEIDQVVMGVANLAQFEENVRLAEMTDRVLPLLPELRDLAIEDERILMPMFWP